MTAVDISTLKPVVDVYRNACAEIKRWERIRDELNVALKEAVGDAEVGTVDGVPAISVKRIPYSRFDSKMFKDDFPELAEKYMVSSVQTRLTIINAAAT